METLAPPKERTRIAVPYYGALVHPRTGLAHLFFLAEIDGTHRGRPLQLGVWNMQSHPRLGDWLKTQNVSALLCREPDNPHLRELEREGFRVIAGAEGDAEEMVARWIDSAEWHSGEPISEAEATG